MLNLRGNVASFLPIVIWSSKTPAIVPVWRTDRVASVLVLAGLAAFVVLTALAAAAYPGGTFCDASATSYRFWENFFCDLTQPVTQRGEDNAHARALAKASFVAFSFALAAFFWVLGGLVGGRRGRVTRSLGLLSAAGTNLVAWLPSAASAELHQVAVFSAAIAGLVAALGGVWGLFAAQAERAGKRAPARLSGILGVLTLAFGALDAAYYAYAVAVPACYVWLPVLQKSASLCLIAWMASVARAGLLARVR